MLRRILQLILVILIHEASSLAQNYPQDYFRAPLDGTIQLTGNFGELRSSHFHSGLDFRTNKSIGLPVFSSADGYISRIRVHVHGYGKALHITHHNGFTTVYAHLHGFATPIDSLVRSIQYQNKFYEIDISFPEHHGLKIRKGQVIGYSGNTGSSTGPHLHFEIRDTKTDEAINPLLFGFNVPDNKKPIFSLLKINPESPSSLISGKPTAAIFHLESQMPGEWRIKRQIIPEVAGPVSFSVSTYDMEKLQISKNAIFQLKLSVDDSLLFSMRFERFSFEEGSRVNAHCDKEARTNGHLFHQCRVLPNDDTQFYSYGNSRGIFQPIPGKEHIVKVEASDIRGNTSTLTFKIRGRETNGSLAPHIPPGTLKIIDWRKASEFTAESIKLFFPENSLFDTLYLYVSKSDRLNLFGYSNYFIGPQNTPLKKKYSISIRFNDSPIPKERFCIVHGSKFLKTKFDKGFLTAQTDRFGEFTVKADTTKPDIRFLFNSCQDLSGIGFIQARVRDKESGIRYWYAELDGQFLIFEYEYKDNLMYAEIPFLGHGEHVVDLWVQDNSGNTSYAREYFRTGSYFSNN